VHHFQVETGGPVGIFFPEEIHKTNLIKKGPHNNVGAFKFLSVKD
jgi:hypothetical protein